MPAAFPLSRCLAGPGRAITTRSFHRTGAGGLPFSYHIEKFDTVETGAEQFENVPLRAGRFPLQNFTDVSVGENHLSTHRAFISNSTQGDLFGLSAAKQNQQGRQKQD